MYHITKVKGFTISLEVNLLSSPGAKFCSLVCSEVSENSKCKVNNIKVAPYSFTIAHAGTLRLKENVSVFQYFMTSAWEQKAKLTMNFRAFPSVKFCKFGRLVVNILL